MQTSDYLIIINKTIKSSYIVLLCMVSLVWLNQQSLNQYWALHFHHESPWMNFSSPLWLSGAKVMHAAETAKNIFTSQLLDEKNTQEVSAEKRVVSQPEKTIISASDKHPLLSYPQNDRQLSKWLSSGRNSDGTKQDLPQSFMVASLLYDEKGAALLSADRKVLFIGDSMMEGVAPRVLRLLKDDYNIEGINLSKRSTGLAYPDFFNWPEAIAKTLGEHTDIGLLVVFLGPNDPWDMPVKRGQPYLRFGSEAWKEEYRHRINKILDCARQYNIPVVWILPPNMKKEKLNRGMAVLRELYEREVKNIGGIVLKVNEIFSYTEVSYSPFVIVNGKKVNVRASDGIHYSPAGSQMIAQAIMGKINFLSQGSEGLHEK